MTSLQVINLYFFVCVKVQQIDRVVEVVEETLKGEAGYFFYINFYVNMQVTIFFFNFFFVCD